MVLPRWHYPADPLVAVGCLPCWFSSPNNEDLLAILYLSILSTVLAYIWFVVGVERIGATSASSYVFLVPPFGVLGGWLLLGERLGVSLIIGFLLIVGGVRAVQKESSVVGRSGR